MATCTHVSSIFGSFMYSAASLGICKYLTILATMICSGGSQTTCELINREPTEIDCFSRNTQSIPRWDSITQNYIAVIKIDLSNNRIQLIPNNSFVNFLSLKNLDLRNNRLTSLSKYAFSGLDELMYLFLTHNNISRLNKGLFTNLPKLTRLNIANNAITFIEKGAFLENLGNLQFIDLSSNQITHVEQEVFVRRRGSRHPVNLNLGQNRILCEAIHNISMTLERGNIHPSTLVCFQTAATSITYVTKPPNHQTTKPPNHQTTKPPNHQTTKPPNHQTTKPPNHRSLLIAGVLVLTGVLCASAIVFNVYQYYKRRQNTDNDEGSTFGDTTETSTVTSNRTSDSGTEVSSTSGTSLTSTDISRSSIGSTA